MIRTLEELSLVTHHIETEIGLFNGGGFALGEDGAMTKMEGFVYPNKVAGLFVMRLIAADGSTVGRLSYSVTDEMIAEAMREWSSVPGVLEIIGELKQQAAT